MKFAYSAAAAVSFGALAALSTPASAFEIPDAGLTVTATPAIVSDYLVRGVSQTRSRPAAQLTLDVEHTSGFYVGAFASNVSFAGTDARQELDGLVGYRFDVAGMKVDLGAIYYAYPGYDYPSSPDLNYYELAAKFSYTLDPAKLLLSYYYSPDFTGQTGPANYIEAGTDITLPYDFTLSGRIGYQTIHDKGANGKSLDYLNYSVAVSRELYEGITLSVGYYATNYSKYDAVAYKTVEPRFMFMLSKTF